MNKHDLINSPDIVDRIPDAPPWMHRRMRVIVDQHAPDLAHYFFGTDNEGDV